MNFPEVKTRKGLSVERRAYEQPTILQACKGAASPMMAGRSNTGRRITEMEQNWEATLISHSWEGEDLGELGVGETR